MIHILPTLEFLDMKGKNRKVMIDFFRDQSHLHDKDSKLVKRVEDIVVLFHKVLKSFRLYPINNPVFKNFAEDFKNRLDELHTIIPVLPLRITKNSFNFNKIPIESSGSDGEELVYILFNDGIRELYFQDGISYDEILKFFRILAKVTVYQSDDYDIATLFWDSDFDHISYVTEEELIEVESFFEKDFELSYDLKAKSVLDGDMPKLDSEEYVESLTIDVKKMAVVTTVIKNEFTKKVGQYDENIIITDFIKLVSSQILKGTDPLAKRELINTASELWKKLFFFGAVKDGVRFLKAILAIGTKLKVREPDALNEIRRGLLDLSKEEFIESIFSVGKTISEEDFPWFAELISMIPKGKLEIVLTMITDLDSRALRLICLKQLATKNKDPELIVPLLKHNNWYIIRNTLYLMKFARSPEMLPYLRPVINHPMEQIRIEALDVLASYSPDEALPALEKAVFSPDKHIRILVLQKILEMNSMKAKVTLDRILRPSNLKNRDTNEVEEYIDLILGSGKEHYFDLVANFLLSDDRELRRIAIKHLVKLQSLDFISRQLKRAIDSPEFLEMSVEDVKSLMLLVRPENFKTALPSLEKIFTLKGPLLKRNIYRDYKFAIFSSFSPYLKNHEINRWLDKGLSEGNKETAEIIVDVRGK